MQENLYLLKISKSAEKDAQRRLLLSNTPSYLRLATLAPLSNYGYPAGSEGTVLSITADGIVFGVEDDPEVPRSFVPWQNISYIADGSTLQKNLGTKKGKKAARVDLKT